MNKGKGLNKRNGVDISMKRGRHVGSKLSEIKAKKAKNFSLLIDKVRRQPTFERDINKFIKLTS